MRRADLYIIAAGTGSRMNTHVPKALIPISDEPCLTTTLQQVSHKFRKVFLVSNILAKQEWNIYFGSLRATHPELASLVVDIPIESGLGDGHATLQGILAAERLQATELARDMVVVWGDVFIPHGEIIDELLSTPLHGSGLIPAIRENNPYVSLMVNESMQCVSADFSKYGETRDAGLHDQSVFLFSTTKLRKSLSEIHCALWKSGRYISPSGELSLLFSLHQLYNCRDAAYVYETLYPTMSFNTIEEVAEIQKNISERWKRGVLTASQLLPTQ